MKKNIKRVMGILLAATMSISLVMPAFASQTSNTDEATEVQEQNEQTDANGSADTANDTQTTGGSSDQGTDEQKENTADSTGSSMNSDTSDVNASDTGSSDTDKKTSDNAAQAPVEGTVTQDTETKKEPVKGEVQTEVADDNVVVGKHDKPYLALGADLTAEQQATVLGLMGIDPAKLSDYDVVQVTNAMEHEYLDAYLPSSTIGSRALSSVLIMEGKNYSDIPVWRRYTLTIEEAARYYHIGEGKLRTLIDTHPNEDFYVMNGNRALIKREKFERYLDQATAV